MPREFSRAERVSEAVQEALAVLIREEIRDPRVGMVNVNSVDVSRDLAYAKVHVTFVGDRSEDDISAAVIALNGASGYLRKCLAASIKLRVTPKLTFLYDETGRRGEHLSALIDYAMSTQQASSESVDLESKGSKGR